LPSSSDIFPSPSTPFTNFPTEPNYGRKTSAIC
jgi:hypothetical protein